eukprot:GHVL01010671.1.p2 GENE.GHVL01010671.1~~GHVL01010671.1.p2  ORF type:complete len:123 (-),score=4.41 GHVL01010671.1:56-424(-)
MAVFVDGVVDALYVEVALGLVIAVSMCGQLQAQLFSRFEVTVVVFVLDHIVFAAVQRFDDLGRGHIKTRQGMVKDKMSCPAGHKVRQRVAKLRLESAMELTRDRYVQSCCHGRHSDNEGEGH